MAVLDKDHTWVINIAAPGNAGLQKMKKKAGKIPTPDEKNQEISLNVRPIVIGAL